MPGLVEDDEGTRNDGTPPVARVWYPDYEGQD
jgi:hypothetical protein